MIFDLQLFADVTIDNNAEENGKVTGASDPINYTITTIPAEVSINVEELSEELQAVLAEQGSLTGTVDGTEVTIDSEGKVADADDDLIGKTITFSANGSEDSATFSVATPSFLNDAEGNPVGEGTYEVYEKDYDPEDEEAVKYTVITNAQGQITSVSASNGEEVTVADLPDDLQTAAGAGEEKTATAEYGTGYEGTVAAAGLTFTVAVDTDGVATFTSGETTVQDGGTYTQEGVNVGTYTINADSLKAKEIKATSEYGLTNITGSDITVVDGVSSINFSNGVAVTLGSDTKTIVSVTGADLDSSTGKVSLNGITYTLSVEGSSGTLVADSAPSYTVDLKGSDTAVAGSDVVNYTAKAKDVTLNYTIAAHDSKSTETLTAQLAAGTGYEIVDAAAGTFKLTGAETVYTATTKVDAAALTLSGEVFTPGGATSSETFKATSGVQTATFSDKLSGDVHLVTTDGSTWTLADSDTTFATGLDTLTVSYNAGVVTASLDHGLTSSEAAKFVKGDTPGQIDTTTSITPGYAVVGGSGTTISFGLGTSASTDLKKEGDWTVTERKGETIGSGTATAKVTADGNNYTVSLDFKGTTFSGKVTSGDLTGEITNDKPQAKMAAVDGIAYAVNVASNAFADGKLDDSDITVTRIIDKTLTEGKPSATTDGITETAANPTQLVTYKFDDSHYYAFHVNTDGTIDTSAKVTETVGGASLEFNETKYAYFSADGKTNWTAIEGATVNNGSAGGVLNVTNATTENSQNASEITVVATNTNNQLTGLIITPTGKQTITGKLLADTSVDRTNSKFSFETDIAADGSNLYATTTANNQTVGSVPSNYMKYSLKTQSNLGFDNASEYSITINNIYGLVTADNENTKLTGTQTVAKEWKADTVEVNYNGTIFTFNNVSFLATSEDDSVIGISYDNGATASNITGTKASDYANGRLYLTADGVLTFEATTATTAAAADSNGNIRLQLTTSQTANNVGSFIAATYNGNNWTTLVNASATSAAAVSATETKIDIGGLRNSNVMLTTINGATLTAATLATNVENITSHKHTVTSADVAANTYRLYTNGTTQGSVITVVGDFNSDGSLSAVDANTGAIALENNNDGTEGTAIILGGTPTIAECTNSEIADLVTSNTKNGVALTNTIANQSLSNNCKIFKLTFNGGTSQEAVRYLYVPEATVSESTRSMTVANEAASAQDNNTTVYLYNAQGTNGYTSAVAATTANSANVVADGNSITVLVAAADNESGNSGLVVDADANGLKIDNPNGYTGTGVAVQANPVTAAVTTAKVDTEGNITITSPTALSTYIRLNTNVTPPTVYDVNSLYSNIYESYKFEKERSNTESSAYLSARTNASTINYSYQSDGKYAVTLTFDTTNTGAGQLLDSGNTVVATTEVKYNVAANGTGIELTSVSDGSDGTASIVDSDTFKVGGVEYDLKASSFSDVTIVNSSTTGIINVTSTVSDVVNSGTSIAAFDKNYYLDGNVTLIDSGATVYLSTTASINGSEGTTLSAGKNTIALDTSGTTYEVTVKNGDVESISKTTAGDGSVSSLIFSDTTTGSFTLDTDGKIIDASLTSGAAISISEGTATWSDTSFSYSATLKDTNNNSGYDASDTMVISKTSLSTVATEAHYEGSVTIDGKTYTAKTDSSDVSTAKISIYNEAGSDVTTQASALYTFKLNDNGTAADTSDDFFTYYNNTAFSETAKLGTAEVKGTVKSVEVTKTYVGSDTKTASFTFAGGTTPNTYTDAQGTVYTLVDAEKGEFSITTGAAGTSETFTADSTLINRTISGAKIGGVAVTIEESGTSATALNLVNISGEGVTFSGTTLTIAGMNYSVSGGNSAYTAAGDKDALTVSSDVNTTATTYTFSAAGSSYTLAIGTDNKVYNYADGQFGAEQSDITVTGDIIYTFNYDDSDNSAKVTGKFGEVQTYTTSSSLTEKSIGSVTIDGVKFLTDDLTESYTTTFGGKTYSNFVVEGETVTYEEATAATIYGKATGDEVQALTLSDGSILTADAEGTYTATWTVDEQTFTTVGTVGQIISALSSVGSDEVGVTLVKEITGDVTAAGTASASFITDTNTQTTYAIVNNEVEVAGTVLTFTKDGATYTSASAADGREITFSGDSFILAGKEDAVLAEKGEDGVWHVAEGVDNVVNTTGAPLEFVSADGDAGVLADGASYNTETNELTNAGEGSLVKNETGYASSNGSITGVEDASYDEEGNLILSGASDGAKVGDTELPVSGDDNFGATLGADGSVKAVDGVSDGATVDISKVDEIGAEEGAEVTLIGDGEAKLNGADIAVSGDEDGIKATAAADGVSAISDLDSGATASVPAGTPVSTGGSGEFNLNGKTLNVTGDEDGVTLTPNEDGSYALDGLNGTSEGDAFLTSEDELTVAIGDDTYAVGPDSSLKADASGAASTYDKADKSVDDILEELGLEGQSVTKLDADQITTDEDGNKVLDLSDADPGIFRLPDDEEPYTVELPEAGGSTAIIPDGVECDIEINGSDKGDKFVNLSKNAKMTARGGVGPDFFRSASPDDVLDLSAGGQDTLDVMENGAVLVGYDPTAEEAPAILVSGAEDQDDFIGMIKQGEVNFGDNKIGNVSLDDLAAEDDRTLAKFVTGDGESQLYAWTGNEGGELDVTDLESPVIAVGNSKGDHEGTKINLGEGNTGIAGAGDEIKPGAGSTIELVDNADDDKEGAKIDTTNNTTKGTVTVNDFVGGFNKGAHGFKGGFTSFSFLNGAMQFLAGVVTYAVAGLTRSLAFEERNDDEVTTTSATETADATNPSSGVLEYKMTGDDGTTTNNVAIAADKTYSVTSETPEDVHFIGESVSSGANNTTVDFSAISEDVAVDLSDNIISDNYDLYNIQNIKGGAGNSSLIGSDGGSNGLYAGSGNSSIWSAAGNDTMYGNTETGKKESTFVFIEGSGNDLVKDFGYGSDENADKVDFMAADLSGADMSSSGDLKVGLTNGDSLTLEGANNEVIKAQFYGNEMQVELGDNLVYDANVDLYGALNGGNKLTASGSDDVEIYMNDLDGSGVIYNDIEVVDASGVTGNAKIAGKDYSNDTIKGGAGNNSLWGGFGGDDSLVGGSGTNTFFYLIGDGEDTISNAKDGDVVELLGISIDDIDIEGTIQNSSNSAIEVKFNDGGSVKVTGSGLTGVGFKVDGTTWKRSATEGWKKA